MNNYITSFERLAEAQENKRLLLTKLPRGWNGHELMTTEFPPPHWSVVNLIPTGAILLSGVFKVGKSWLMLQLADCVSKGKPFLGHETNSGSVLYLALEDGPGRIKRRAMKMGIVLSENVHIFTSWLAGDDGINSLDAWLEAHPSRLVIIDTLSRWQDNFRGNDIWARDTKRIADLKTIADRHDITVLIVHHRSKATRDDIHQSVAGTNALQGAADGSLILDKKRNENIAKLSVVGRDISERELSIEFTPESCTWKALDYDPTELLLNQERRDILDTIIELGGTARVKQIAEKLSKEKSNISHLLRKMVYDGIIYSLTYGSYTIAKPIQTDQTLPTQGFDTLNSMNTLNGGLGLEEFT